MTDTCDLSVLVRSRCSSALHIEVEEHDETPLNVMPKAKFGLK